MTTSAAWGAPALQRALDIGALGYLTNDDHLRLRVYNSGAGVIIGIDGRIALPNGTIVPFADTLAPATDRTASTKLVRLTEGVLLGVGVRAVSGAPRRGQTWVVVELVRGFTGDVQSIGTLVQGYLSETTRRAMPGSLLEDSTDGRGVIRSITGTDPAANTEISETVPTNARWRLIGWRATLVTDGNVANRRVNLTIDDGTNTLLLKPPGADQAASLTYIYQADAHGAASALLSTTMALPLPPDLILMGGSRIRTATNNIQAGDNWSAPQMLVEEWIED